jgi:actin-related protein
LQEDYERLLSHAFYNALRMAPEEHPLIISEPTLCPRATRQATCQILFETFACPRVLQCSEAVMAAAAAGATSGIVLDVGHEWSRACAVYEGHAISHTHGSASLSSCCCDWSKRALAWCCGVRVR